MQPSTAALKNSLEKFQYVSKESLEEYISTCLHPASHMFLQYLRKG